MSVPSLTRTLGLALALALVTTPAVATAPPQRVATATPSQSGAVLVIPGGDFEGAVAPQLPAGWVAAGGGDAVTAAAAARNGLLGAQVTSTAGAPTSLTSPEVELKAADQPVVFYRAMVKGVVATPQATLQVVFTRADGSTAGTRESTPTATTVGAWTEIDVTAATPSDAKSVRAKITLAGAGTTDVDDVAADVREQRELVPDGGAEQAVVSPATGAISGWAASSVQWQPMDYPNASAELGTTAPQNWKTYNYATVKAGFAWDSSVAHNGSHSLRIDGAAGAIGDWQPVTYPAITPGIYKFGFWVRGQGAAPGEIRPDVIFRNAAGQTIGGDHFVQTTVGTADWTFVETTLTAPTGTANLRIDYRLYNAGTAWFDDVTVAKQATAPGVAAGNVATVDSAIAYAGHQSLTVINHAASDGTTLESDAFPVERLAGYNLSAAIRTAGVTVGALAGAVFLDANGTPLGEQVTSQATSEGAWSSVSGRVFPPAAATEARAFVRLLGPGQAWFDDVSVVRTTTIDTSVTVDKTRGPSLLLGPSDVEGLRTRVKSGVVGAEYQRQLGLSQKWTVEQLQNPTYLVNPYRTQSVLFTAPAGAAGMTLSADFGGQGSSMVDAVSLTSLATNQPVAVTDGTFEAFGTPSSGWQTTSQTSGATVERTTDWAFDGVASLHYAGSTPADGAVVSLKQQLPASGGTRYSLGATISQRGLIDGSGLTWKVAFVDAAGNPVGSPFLAPAYNWDTHTRWDSPLFEATQASADVYLVTGDEQAARKAILGLKYLIGESVWGMDYVLTTGSKPNGEDGYGAVHFGRAMGGFAQALDLVMGSRSMTDEDRAWLTDRLGWMQDTEMNLAYYDYSTPAGRISNWNLDRAIGVGMVAITLPNLTSAQTYREHAEGEVVWMLDNVVGEDGAFPETIRYHVAPLVRLVPFAEALTRAGGPNLLNNEKLKKMFSFLITVQTPVDSTNTSAPGTILSPAIGDANYNEVPYRTLGWSAGLYKTSDPTLSAQMQWTWKRAGEPVADTGANPWPLQPLLATDPSLPTADPHLTSTAVVSVGYDILRNQVGTPSEDYMIMSDTPRPLGHNHDDRTGFSLWGDSVPLALDSGVGGYFNGDNVWFNSAAAHNVVQFQVGTAWAGTAPQVTTPIRFYSPQLDVVQAGGATPGATDYQRNVLQLKGPFGAYLIWDRIQSSQPSRFNLHTLTTSIDQQPGLLVAHGYNGVDLDVHLLGAQPSITLDKGAVSGDWPQKDQQWLQLGQPAGVDHTVLLQPRATSAAPLETRELTTGSPTVKAFEITAPTGERAIVVLNDGNTTAPVDLGLTGSWTAATPAASGSATATGAQVAGHQAVVLLQEAA